MSEIHENFLNLQEGLSEHKQYLNGNSGMNDNGFRNHSSVIKQSQVRSGNENRVKIPVNHATNSDQPRIEPILEEGQIVGIQFTCSCHRSTEIRFDYEEDSTPSSSPEDSRKTMNGDGVDSKDEES